MCIRDRLALKEFIEPQDLIDLPIVTSIGDYQETILNHWFGKYQDLSLIHI